MDLATKGRDAMSSFDSPAPRNRSRRRLAAWLAFGAIGLATGAVWASGFTSFTGLPDASPAGSPAMTKGIPADDVDPLTGKAAKEGDLTFDWTGRWGSLTSDTWTVKVDLRTFATAKHYNVAVLLANTSDLTDWASMQLKFERVTATGTTCDPTDFSNVSDPKVLNFNNQDAGVYWNGLQGGSVYCIGVKAASGDDPLGTFLRSADDSAPTHFPSFITTVDRKD